MVYDILETYNYDKLFKVMVCFKGIAYTSMLSQLDLDLLESAVDGDMHTLLTKLCFYPIRFQTVTH